MNYSADKPILASSEDRLGREAFSEQLAEAICNYKGNESIVIGLFGEWGSGKSSIINMTLQNISHTQNNPIIMRFAPWNYIDKNNLIGCFFNELQAKIRLHGNSKLKKNVGKALKDYADVIDVAAYIPIVGFAVAPTLKSIARFAGEGLSKTTDLDTAKKKLSDALIKSERKILVVIDDIDRLYKTQIQDVFQLVKQVGDLPNIVYVLAMDRTIVANALSDVQNSNGNEYLKKIVQIPFEIPAIRNSQLYAYFVSEVYAVINSMLPEKTVNKDLLRAIYMYCVSPYIHTLRDVNRIVNVLKFRLGLLSVLVIEDLIGITAIEVLNPELYSWIRTNKMDVCHADSDVNTEERRAHFVSVFEKIGLNPSLSCHSLSILFPAFGKQIGDDIRRKYTDFNPSSGIEISTENGFDNCFAFNLDVNSVDSNEINYCAYIFDENEIKNCLQSIITRGLFGYFVNEFKFIIGSVPYSRLCLIASVVISFAPKLEKKENSNQAKNAFTVNSAVNFLLDIVLQFKTEDEFIEFFEHNIEISNDSSFHLLCCLIYDVMRGYVRYSYGYEFRNRISGLYVQKAKDLLQNVYVSDLKAFLITFNVWLGLDKSSYVEFYNNNFTHDIDKLKFLCLFVRRSKEGFYIRIREVQDYFPYENISKLLYQFDPRSITAFNDLERIYVAGLWLSNYRQILKRPKYILGWDFKRDEAEDVVYDWLKSVKKF